MGSIRQAQGQIRLHALIARKAQRAVVFRRGPSKQVLLVNWDLRQDRFTFGQWFKGRLYERRCDVSADGRHLVYFAAKWQGPYESWTAISRPPYLTALALWPKGDAWGGGGLFTGRSSLQLNHPPHQFELASGYRLPKKLRVEPFGEHSGSGEDAPVYWHRLLRDGWTLRHDCTEHRNEVGSQVWIVYDPAQSWEKPQPGGAGWMLRMDVVGVHEVQGPWYLTEYSVHRGEDRIDLGRTDWAEWCPRGDLLFGRDGKLFRARLSAQATGDGAFEPIQLIDLSELKLARKEPPPAALTWRRRLPA